MDAPVPQRLRDDLLRAGVAALMQGTQRERLVAADRFLTGASLARLDVSRAFGVVSRDASGTAAVREACLAVPGAGRTAMLLVSRPPVTEQHADRLDDERTACVRAAAAACEPPAVHLVQALPAPDEPWTIRSLEDAGFVHAGDLAYLERRLSAKDSSFRIEDWPEGIRCCRMIDGPADDLVEALDASYQDTLDCPELFGLRETTDIIESHRAVGEPHDDLWLVLHDVQGPCGCMLVSGTAETGVSELVYLGLAPRVRGRGLAKRLLTRAILGMHAAAVQRLVCAVDRRNVPARNLYKQLGFREFSARCAFVLSTRNHTNVANQ